jgi:hypothetical protein
MFLGTVAALLQVAAASSGAMITECLSAECVQSALQLDGAVSLHVPGLGTAREVALLAMADCSAGSVVTLPDRTSRRSIGARSVDGIAEPLSLERGRCAGLDEATAALRALVDSATQRLLQSVQSLQVGPTAVLAAGGRSYGSLAAVARAGEQLEHFHAYVSSETPAASDHDSAPMSSETASAAAAVPLHTDAGLLIALVPALYAAVPKDPTFSPGTQVGGVGSPAAPRHKRVASPREGGFFVRRWDGSDARVAPTAEDSSAVFVIGEGWAHWINPQLRAPLRVAPHRMVMPVPHRLGVGEMAHTPTTTRLWYGRMYLPPKDAVQHPQGQPFGTWRAYHMENPLDDAMAAASKGEAEVTAALPPPSIASDPRGLGTESVALLPTGCGGGRRFLATANPSLCFQNQIFCWHQCVDVSALPCGDQVYPPSKRGPMRPTRRPLL